MGTGKSMRPIGAAVATKTANQSTENAAMDPAPDEGSAAAEAAQQLTNVLLPMDATPTLAAHVAPHAAFVSSISERADVVLASALFRELSQRFEKLTPLQRFSLHLSLLKHAPSELIGRHLPAVNLKTETGRPSCAPQTT